MAAVDTSDARLHAALQQLSHVLDWVRADYAGEDRAAICFGASGSNGLEELKVIGRCPLLLLFP
jgi:hypothetical protein